MIITIISDDVWERGSAIGVAKRVCDDDIIIRASIRKRKI